MTNEENADNRNNPDLLYKIALTQIPSIGNVLAKNLMAYCGSAEKIFKQSKTRLLKIPGIGEKYAGHILGFTDFSKAEEEVKFIEKEGIQPVFYTDSAYPERLKNIPDAPVILYFKGKGDFNLPRMVGIVGTRMATAEGKEFCEKLVEGLKPYNCTIISGLAYGIDIAAHKAAVQHNMPTVAVLAHGLDKIYPALHANTAKKMMDNGGLLTEYPKGTQPDKENFPTRNRIVAGMCDAIVVVETDLKGGSMITADIAFSYNRDVFAVPGRPGDDKSKGCNLLIKDNKAALLENAEDLASMMRWDVADATPKKSPKQITMMLEGSQGLVAGMLGNVDAMGIDDISFKTGLSLNETSLALLELELAGLVKGLPGKMFKLIG